jgi:hypothetical protein
MDDLRDHVKKALERASQRMERDAERERALAHERQLAIIRAQPDALIWRGPADELIAMITKCYESGWIIAESLENALQKASIHFLRPDGTLVISPRPEALSPSVPHLASKVETTDKQSDRKVLRTFYFQHFPEAKVLDVCWAAGQHYTEWKRWLRYAVKAGSAPDRAFRAVLTSGKAPQQYRKQCRPNGWR